MTVDSDTPRTPCRSILIVEDDEGIRETLQYALELEGYQVQTASNGQEGLQRLGQMEPPCLVLLDLMMPVMNGWEFADALSHNITLATIPIVVVSAYSERANAIRSREIIKKPVDLDVLFQTVRKWCQPEASAELGQ
jgi:CheY-like chemotaxis protein